MDHKDYKRINVWLKDLREKHYIEWIYNGDHFAEKTKPAIYYLGIDSIRLLKQQTNAVNDDVRSHSIEALRKRYREASRSQTFIDRCLLLGDCGINLRASTANSKEYGYETEADFSDPNSGYHFLNDNELIHPHLLYEKQEHKKTGTITTNYLLEVFDATLPRYRIKKRLSNYVEYLDDGEWQSETGDDKPPIILLVCPLTSDLIYAKRRTRGLLADIQDTDTDEEDGLHIRFATVERLRDKGVTGKIWEEA